MDAVSVTAARGFRAAGVASGIKQDGALDLGLLTADTPAVGAAVFTTNRAAAAPVAVSRGHLDRGNRISGIVANSGCANAATGSAGEDAARAMAAMTSREIGCPPEQVLVASTGPIGPSLPLDKVMAGIGSAASRLERSDEAGSRAAEAIMTTDSAVKEVTVNGDGFIVGGMAKGSGMIRPDMATMLAFLTTDAVVDPGDLKIALGEAVDQSFHSLNIDGCASTNDTVAVMASGRSGVRPRTESLATALTRCCSELSRMMAADAEGARRVVTILVSGAADDATARSAGRAMADSALVRASFFGGDPNWGRLIGAIGASTVSFDPAMFGVAYEGVTVAAKGVAIDFDDELLRRMEEGDLEVAVTIGTGPGLARVLTNDLTPEYVLFNGERS